MFADRPDVLKVLKSARTEKEKRWKEVDGAYTEKGPYRVLRNVKEGVGLLEREQWVVPLTSEEKGDRVAVNLARLAQDYDSRYIDQWTDWLRDITVQTPATVKEAIDLYGTLSRPERPYLRILRALEDHTQWKDKNKSALENEEVNRELKRRVNQKLSAKTGGLRFDIDLKKIGEKESGVPRAFKATVDFGVATTPALDTYLSSLEDLQHKLQKEEDTRGPNLDPRQVQDPLDGALKKANELLQALGDDKSRTILTPLLQNPLKIVTARLPPGGASKVAIPSGSRFPKR
jgi:type VI secretion system protein ImpL